MTAVVTFLVIAVLVVAGIFVYMQYVATDTPQSSTMTIDNALNDMTMTGTSTGNSTTTRTLSRSNSGLSEVPRSILSMTNLEELDLSDNQLTGSLPGEIRQLTRLRVLDVSGNALTGIPAEIGQLSNLRRLDASDNQLTTLPYQIGNLQNLEELNLSGNDISEADINTIRDQLPTSTNIIL